ncbi:TIGR03943 family protein [Phormidium tenue FACHB-886]|nr:TIGR03943 family protein [Phormidium tenue FACHB-886]
MSISAKPNPHRFKGIAQLQPLLDLVALLLWGILLLKFWLTGKINILLHPDYVWLAYSAGFFLIGLVLVKGSQFALGLARQKPRKPAVMPQHFSLFPPGWGSALLLLVALFGLQFTPQPFASQTAIERGVTDTLTMTRSQPQAFRGSGEPAKRSLVEWIRLLNVYPEPDAYTGQPVNLNGFIIHPPEMPQDYLAIARFVITCCAADAYPIGLPVKLASGNRTQYPVDQWFQVEGKMITETLNGKRQLVIQASRLTEIPEPANPYDF